MKLNAEYGVISHQPYLNRSEHINIGILVFMPDGTVRAHFARNLKKLTAFDPQASLSVITGWEHDLPDLLKNHSPGEARQALELLGTRWKLSASLGWFSYYDQQSYLTQVENALISLVEPRASEKPLRHPKSRLLLDLKKAFEMYGWLGHDIHAHQIIQNYPLLPEMGIQADFALQNSNLHIIETLDLRVSSLSGKRYEAQAKAMALNLSRTVNNTTRRYAVIAGGTQADAGPMLNLMTSQSDEVVMWEDIDHVDHFFNTMAHATGKPMMDLPLH